MFINFICILIYAQEVLGTHTLGWDFLVFVFLFLMGTFLHTFASSL